MSIASILEQSPKLAQEWIAQRADRQQRTKGDPADFQRLQEMGVPLMAVPVEFGGTWESLAQSARPICTMLRTLAQGDPSITLASAMHHLVLSSWRIPNAPEPYTEVWEQQRQEVFQTVHDGAWWGTMVSEPGSGGDSSLTVSEAVPESPGSVKYRLSGKKHFASGSGLMSIMTTRAIPEGETAPDVFYAVLGSGPWDGSNGCKLTAEWRGHGMMSTNSHAFEFHDYPATRVAWPGAGAPENSAESLGGIAFTSVITGVVDAAMDYTRQRLKSSLSQGSSLRAFQQVEWAYAEQEAWLIEQAWEGVMRSFDQGTASRPNTLLG
ncbi:MAG: hypothetical protein ACE5Q6_10510, partial [Dehalococcoidia bacterium]